MRTATPWSLNNLSNSELQKCRNVLCLTLAPLIKESNFSCERLCEFSEKIVIALKGYSWVWGRGLMKYLM